MPSWLSKLQSWLVGCNSQKMFSVSIPNHIDSSERIVRVLFYPKHFKKELIYHYAFRSPSNLDEVSVIRINFCDENFCKTQGLSMQEDKNPYYGLAVLSAQQIRSVDADVNYTPEHHKFHADIVVGHVFKTGDPAPPEIKYKIEELATMANVYKDSCPEKETWLDGNVNYK